MKSKELRFVWSCWLKDLSKDQRSLKNTQHVSKSTWLKKLLDLDLLQTSRYFARFRRVCSVFCLCLSIVFVPIWSMFIHCLDKLSDLSAVQFRAKNRAKKSAKIEAVFTSLPWTAHLLFTIQTRGQKSSSHKVLGPTHDLGKKFHCIQEWQWRDREGTRRYPWQRTQYLRSKSNLRLWAPANGYKKCAALCADFFWQGSEGDIATLEMFGLGVSVWVG